MSYRRITPEEWEEIFRLRYVEHLTLHKIEDQAGKEESAVSRELKSETKKVFITRLAAKRPG